MLTRRKSRRYEMMAAEESSSQLVSHANNASQAFLLEHLVRAREALGLSLPEVADRLSADVSMIEDMETGDHEPNLSELRAYAWAVEAVIEYRVHACAGEPLSAFHARMRWSYGSEDVWESGAETSWTDSWEMPLQGEQVREIVQGKVR